MKSLLSKLTVLFIPPLILSAAAGLAPFLIRPLWLGIAVSAFLLMLSVIVFRIIVRFTVLQPIFRMKGEADGEDPFTLSGKDEFSELAERLNRRIDSGSERENAAREELISHIKAAENDKYLLNINEGLLFIDYGQIISKYHSRALGEIFDREEIGGQHLSDFLYPDRNEAREKRKVLEKFILNLFHDPSLIDSIDDEDNPLCHIWISRDDGRRILVDGSFRKVEEDGELVQLMIIFRDRTDEGILEKKLDESDMRSDFELDTIIAILRAGPGPFIQFIEDSDARLSRFRKNIQEIEDRQVLEQSLRDISSMKCSAAYFDFRAVEKLCNNLEDILSGFREGNFSRKEALDIIIDDIYIQFESVEGLIGRFKEFLSSEHGRAYEISKNEQEHFFDTLKIMMARHADELNKKVEFHFSSDFENYEKIGDIKDPIIHLLRNAVDYGIETPEDRLAGGKEEKGKISLVIGKMNDNGVRITVEDDGSGIDFDRIREIAVEKGFIKKEESPGQANLVRTMFSSGFSSRDQMSGLSGRGVGLAAVKESVARLGGKIAVKTERLKGSRFSIDLPSGS
ncbi:ATP-binding protein [Spirochaeta isovalerica]|uniref:histidine kinase n=1 Tax=Spirochaeta isovalerica TaxID=150 RepID=A0A841RA66_9SPIO|nr:ATP-binding protein [Spirochaeta isovalerica]MBB6480793.1 signal transduction histidine kinase [Spirochaeta isovalerica]